MGYRKEDIPGMIEALTLARSLILSKEERFVCYALDRAERPAAYLAKGMVDQAIGGRFTLSSWLYFRHGRRFESAVNMRKLRLRWIDKMIADLKEYAK